MRLFFFLLVFYAWPKIIFCQLDVTYSHLSVSSNLDFDTGILSSNMGEPFIQTHYTTGNIFSLGILQPGFFSITNVEEDFSNEVQVFPNPSNGLIHCSVLGVHLNSLTVYDLTGNAVYYLPFIFSNSFDLSALSAGKYYLCFQTDKRSNLFISHIIL